MGAQNGQKLRPAEAACGGLAVLRSVAKAVNETLAVAGREILGSVVLGGVNRGDGSSTLEVGRGPVERGTHDHSAAFRLLARHDYGVLAHFGANRGEGGFHVIGDEGAQLHGSD